MGNSFIDLIIRIKNSYLAGNRFLESPFSKMKEEILKKFITLGYIRKYSVEGEKIKKISIELVYDGNKANFTDVKIFSKPGRRFYVPYKKIKLVLGGLGHSFLSTPKGILTGREARKQKVGGELLFNIW